MYVRHVHLTDYRSWASVDVPLAPGVNVLVGRNGTGKTNLMEALGYLATLGSHRVASDAPLVRSGSARSVIRAAVVSAGTVSPGRGFASLSAETARLATEPNAPVAVNVAPMA